MELSFFIFMIILAGIFLYFDYRESRKGKCKSNYKQFAFKTVITTILILLTFQLYANNVTVSTGVLETHHYKADNITLDYITKTPVQEPVPFSRELAVIFLLASLYMVYWITESFPKKTNY